MQSYTHTRTQEHNSPRIQEDGSTIVQEYKNTYTYDYNTRIQEHNKEHNSTITLEYQRPITKTR